MTNQCFYLCSSCISSILTLLKFHKYKISKNIVEIHNTFIKLDLIKKKKNSNFNCTTINRSLNFALVFQELNLLLLTVTFRFGLSLFFANGLILSFKISNLWIEHKCFIVRFKLIAIVMTTINLKNNSIFKRRIYFLI